MAITCNAVATGKVGRRYLCTDGSRSWLAGTEYRYNGKLAREVYPPNTLDTKPADGVILHGGWGGNQDANTWSIIKMKDNPELFKIVDDTGKNIMTDYKTQLDAQKSIDYRLFVETDTGTPEPPAPTPTPTPTPTPSADGPYPSIGKEMDSTTRGPTVRHYASGKPDDKTIEKNVKDIKFPAYQFLVDVKVTTIEHNDTVSLKYGGTHMDSGWFDNTIDFETGLVGLGTEEKHPSADLEIVKGDKIGSILNKKIRIAGVYFKKDNKCEMWTNLGNGWKKNAEGKDVGGFNPDSDINEAQLRIDGFEAVPEITRAVVQEIAVPNP